MIIIHTIYIDPTEVGENTNLAEVELRKPRNLFVCVREEREDGDRGEREGEDKQTLSLSSGTHRIHNSLVEDAGRLPVVEFREPRNLCVCVTQDRGNGEVTGPHDTLLTDTRRRVVSLTENTVRMSGVEFREPRNLCVCVIVERGYGEGVYVHTDYILLS